MPNRYDQSNRVDEHVPGPEPRGTVSEGGVDTATGATTGALAGALLGATGGPLGLLAGAIIGGAIGGIAAAGPERPDYPRAEMYPGPPADTDEEE